MIAAITATTATTTTVATAATAATATIATTFATVIDWGNNLPLAQAGNSAAAGNDGSKDVALHGDTEGERADVEEEEVRGLLSVGLASEDGGLDGSTMGNSLIRVDALLKLLAVEELGQELLDAGDTGRTTDQDNLVDLGLLNAGVLEDLGDRLKSAGESLGVQVLETGTGDGHGEVLAIEERVNLNGGLSTARQGTLGTLASSTETAESAGITGQIWSCISRQS